MSILFAVFPGKCFDSSGISEILLFTHVRVTQGFENNRPRLAHAPNKTESNKHVIYRLCLGWALSVKIDYYNLVFTLYTATCCM